LKQRSGACGGTLRSDGVPAIAALVEMGDFANVQGRAFHSSTSQLNLTRFCTC